ncbi:MULTISPECIES: DUF3310 domain-containing protein [unclassified Olsenella]|uniref:DUF3310 domain-containing protein n=1 Tax=unclassified Olsenella TaxID=2638792 RepID=UPI0018F48DB3|nr:MULTISPECIES: DUF3310 domain-containing protein [unclassified Olsenella]
MMIMEGDSEDVAAIEDSAFDDVTEDYTDTLPCPFCGSHPQVLVCRRWYRPVARVWCPSCGILSFRTTSCSYESFNMRSVDSDGADYDAIHEALTDWDKAVREINGVDGKAHGGSVEHPDHYQSDGIECIDALYEVSPEIAINFSVGSALKYLDRAGLKGDETEDLHKAKECWHMAKRLMCMRNSSRFE